MIICVVGTSGSGKTTSCEYIKREFGIPFVEVSDIIWDRYNDSSFSGDIREFVKIQYERNGKNTFTLPAIQQAKKLDSNIKIFCGFRTVEAINFVRNFYDEHNISIVGIHSNSNLKYRRIMEREQRAKISYEEALRKSFVEYRVGLAEIFEQEVDEIIVNEGTIHDFYEQVHQYVQSVLDSFDNTPHR